MRSIIIALALFSSLGFANDYMFNPTPVLITATSSSQQALAQNNLRAYLLVVNTGTNSAWVTFSQKPGTASTNGVLVPGGGNYEPIHAPSNSVWVNTATGVTSSLIFVEGQ